MTNTEEVPKPFVKIPLETGSKYPTKAEIMLSEAVKIVDCYVEVAPEYSTVKIQATRWLTESMTLLRDVAERLGGWQYILYNPQIYIERYLPKEEEHGS